MTSALKRILLILTVFLKISPSAFSQLTLEQMINIKLGETFNESKQQIKSMFTGKATIMKADFFGAYTIEYENVPLNYYGDANYTFQYAKDTLVSVKVEFSFIPKDTTKFRRLYNTLLTDLKNDNSKKLLKQHSNLSAQKIFPYINANCITTTQEDDKNYKPIKSKFLGQNFYSIFNNSVYSGKFLRLFVGVYERHLVPQKMAQPQDMTAALCELLLK